MARIRKARRRSWRFSPRPASSPPSSSWASRSSGGLPRRARSSQQATRSASIAIAKATGESPRLYRPPHGIFTVAGLAFAWKNRLTPVLWSCDGRDWRVDATSSSIASLITRRVRAGDIVLLHDADWYSARGSWRHTVGALPHVLDTIADRSISFVPA